MHVCSCWRHHVSRYFKPAATPFFARSNGGVTVNPSSLCFSRETFGLFIRWWFVNWEFWLICTGCFIVYSEIKQRDFEKRKDLILISCSFIYMEKKTVLLSILYKVYVKFWNYIIKFRNECKLNVSWNYNFL